MPATGCPGTGLAGRLNQAAQFSAFENVGNALTLGNSAVNRLTNNYSVAGMDQAEQPRQPAAHHRDGK